MSATAVEVCQLCESFKVRSIKVSPNGAHPFCPRCDRRLCGKCKAPVLDPRATRCCCGQVLGMS